MQWRSLEWGLTKGLVIGYKRLIEDQEWRFEVCDLTEDASINGGRRNSLKKIMLVLPYQKTRRRRLFWDQRDCLEPLSDTHYRYWRRTLRSCKWKGHSSVYEERNLGIFFLPNYSSSHLCMRAGLSPWSFRLSHSHSSNWIISTCPRIMVWCQSPQSLVSGLLLLGWVIQNLVGSVQKAIPFQWPHCLLVGKGWWVCGVCRGASPVCIWCTIYEAGPGGTGLWWAWFQVIKVRIFFLNSCMNKIFGHSPFHFLFLFFFFLLPPIV